MKIMLAKKEERRSETLSQGTCEDRRHCREDRNTGNCMGHQGAHHMDDFKTKFNIGAL